tara:strand:+ start:33 stop:590 length:558 start_codon:yes stop_codon:yes gene_type:complete
MTSKEFPNKEYNIIYADPPWSYRDKRNTHKRICGGALSHYETLTMEEIYNLPIKEISAENCYLFLWVTFPNLIDCVKTFDYWGFTYKTLGFSWVKLNKINKKPFFGIGYYTKSNAEVCLLGIKGKVKPKSNFVSSVIMEPRDKHSKKPSIVRDKIVELCGDLPRIELFARQKIEGWDSWGKEINE